jgi:hypothetical protein
MLTSFVYVHRTVTYDAVFKGARMGRTADSSDVRKYIQYAYVCICVRAYL